jgi:NADPH-dependent glutamate synthase beta subunit-like oxidoreductase
LRGGCDAVFLGIGAERPKRLGVEGEHLEGVLNANVFLREINLNGKDLELGENTVVIGGGNVAMDVARAAVRLGSGVVVAYRKNEAQMKARAREIGHAKEEGVVFEFMLSPEKFLGNGNEEVETAVFTGNGSAREFDADSIVVAIGQNPNTFKSNAIARYGDGRLKVDSKYRTSLQGVFAAGDCVSGSATVVEAIAGGNAAALEIASYLRTK